MDLRQLSVKESVLISLRAEGRCVAALESLAQRLEPADPAMTQRLRELAENERSHQRTLSEYDETVDWPREWHLSESAISRILREKLPALFSTDLVLNASPERALETARQIEQESGQFYLELAHTTHDEGSRALFKDLADRELAHLEEL